LLFQIFSSLSSSVGHLIPENSSRSFFSPSAWAMFSLMVKSNLYHFLSINYRPISKIFFVKPSSTCASPPEERCSLTQMDCDFCVVWLHNITVSACSVTKCTTYL
jgi:hypothetical protein